MYALLRNRSTGKANFNGKTSWLFGYKGMNFTARQIACLLEVAVGTVYSRLHKGYAVDAVCRRGRLAKIHTIEGRDFTTKDISLAFGIPTYKVYNILRKCALSGTKVSLGMFVK